VLTGREDAYAWDNIGNRSTATHNSQLTTYTSTLLNTYSQRTVPGIFDVAGAAGPGTTVTVNSSSTGVTRHGEYFFKGQSLSNNPNAVFSTLAVSDGTTTANITAFLAGTPEPFTYDDDGNLLSDGRWDYTYDAENRLVSITTRSALFPSPIPAADARRLEFKNDYLGRRVQKTVLKRNPGNTAWVTDTDEKFVYDGWNAIARLNASSLSLIASHYWGLDWSGTLKGAGGVGGLALTVEGGNIYLPMFDGNGNVMGMVKASTGSIDAAYEYDAFGNTLRESGTYAASNPFRFSSKYTDIETGLVYYGLRYYSPSLGRFINKDPIGEQGGLNLYGYCQNNGVNKYDVLGMWPTISFMPVHQNSIDRALSFLPEGTRANLKFAQIVADSSVFQSLNFSFVHAMTGGSATASNRAFFRVESGMFVNAAINMAQQAYAAGDTETGDLYSGIALHPIQDSTSPSHAVFAAWYGTNSVFTALAHIARELHDPGPGSQLDQATRYGYSLTQLPAEARPDDPYQNIYHDDFNYGAEYEAQTPKKQEEMRNNGKRPTGDLLGDGGERW
jgi:RHS repeat-associated protein